MTATVALAINISADEYQGDAMANVSLDGMIGPQNIDVSALHSAGATQSVALGQVDPTVTHSVAVTFQQDAYGGSPALDRNLYIVSYTLGGLTAAVPYELAVAGTYTFTTAPISMPAGDPAAADIAAAVAAVEAHEDADMAAIEAHEDADTAKILAAIAAIPAGSSSGAPSAPTAPAPYSGPKLDAAAVGAKETFATVTAALPAMNPAGVITVDAATYTDAVDFPAAVTLKSVTGTASDVVFDGQGGYTQGHRLAYGKAMHHLSAPCMIEGVSYRNCGGLPYDASYENQAGIYAEGFTGTVTLSNLALDGNNDGIFVPSVTSAPGSAVSIALSGCTFGKLASNGADQSGLTHDYYLNGPSTTDAGSIHHGCTYGNNKKSRSPVFTVNGGFSVSTGGRWINYPDAGLLTVNGGTVVIDKSAPNENLFSYGDESQANGVNLKSSVVGVTFYIGRYNTTFYVCAGMTLDMSTCKVVWTDPGASIAVTGGGTIVGLPIGTPVTGTVFGTAPAIPTSV